MTEYSISAIQDLLWLANEHSALKLRFLTKYSDGLSREPWCNPSAGSNINTSEVFPTMNFWVILKCGLDTWTALNQTRKNYELISFFLFCSTSLPLARVLDGFDQSCQAFAVHSSKQQRRWLTSAASTIFSRIIFSIFLGMPGIEHRAAGCRPPAHLFLMSLILLMILAFN